MCRLAGRLVYCVCVGRYTVCELGPCISCLLIGLYQLKGSNSAQVDCIVVELHGQHGIR